MPGRKNAATLPAMRPDRGNFTARRMRSPIGTCHAPRRTAFSARRGCVWPAVWPDSNSVEICGLGRTLTQFRQMEGPVALHHDASLEGAMSDRLSRAARYRELAAEREQLAMLATDDRVRVHYQNMAAYYLMLAQAEMKLVAKHLGK
jgi:hypothetical protein